jgi:hypothetical protein
MKRTPLRPGTKPFRRRKALRTNPESAYQLEYLANIPLVKERSGGSCEVMYPHDCDFYATGRPHHRKFRSQGGTNDPVNLLAVCTEAHFMIHNRLPRQTAVDAGLIIERDQPETPYLGMGHGQP